MYAVRFLALSICIVLIVGSDAAGQDTRRLEHDDVNAWNHISNRTLSDNGEWVLWETGPAEGDATLHVHHATRDQYYTVFRGEDALFSGDQSHVVFMLRAPFDSTRQARIDGKKGDDLPPDSVGILDLNSGSVTLLDEATSFKVPAEDGARVAYKLTDAAAADDAPPDTSATEEPAEEPSKTESDSTDVDTPDKPETASLAVHDLASGETIRVDDVAEYVFSEDGNWLAVTRYGESDEREEGEGEDGGDQLDGVYLLPSGAATPQVVLGGEGRYLDPVFDEDGTQLAFLSDRADWPAEHPAMDVYVTTLEDGVATRRVEARSEALPDGWWVSEHGDLSFSKSGRRLFFGAAPEPRSDGETDETPALPDNEKVELDVWSWTDPLLQPQQLVQVNRERNRTYLGMLDLVSGRVVQLASDDLPDIIVSDEGDGTVALGESDLPYRQRISWDSPGYQDAYEVDVATGERTMIFADRQVNTSISPAGRYVYWWDGHARHWFAWDTQADREINLTAGLGVPVESHLADRPMIPGPEGAAGWTAGDARFVVYDKHDVWVVDPTNPAGARSVTDGAGRAANGRFRVVDMDRDEPAVEDDLMLSYFDYGSKEQGYYSDTISGNRPPRRLIGGAAAFAGIDKADESDRVIFSRSTFREYPDVWVSDVSLRSPRKLSDANPQQADFSWGTAELVQWTSLDGEVLDGILYKPDGFDATKQYPMMVYFYEKSSSGLFSHFAPRASRSSIDRSFYVSRGYLLFVPDIPYKDGYPGESAMNAVMPGITSLMDAGFVDPDRIGVQGHSWGGYQIAYMVTQTNLFAAAEAGAPVVNMTSAYGGIRWASGLSRMFQYERTQSRIGGTLWDAHHRYIDNSPLFQADKVQTPLLMMHNDEDGAVPWYQGIEYFVALRRLGKPVWMLNYNGQGHGLTNLHDQRDWAIRMQQFFDHYLMDAPPPEWLKNGIPAVEKGETLGLDLIVDG